MFGKSMWCTCSENVPLSVQVVELHDWMPFHRKLSMLGKIFLRTVVALSLTAQPPPQF